MNKNLIDAAIERELDTYEGLDIFDIFGAMDSESVKSIRTVDYADDKLKELLKKHNSGSKVDAELEELFDMFEASELTDYVSLELLSKFGQSYTISQFLIDNIEVWNEDAYNALLNSSSIYDLPADFLRKHGKRPLFRHVVYESGIDSHRFTKEQIKKYLDFPTSN